MTIIVPSPAVPPFVLMTDPARRPDPLGDAAGIARGSWIVLRHYDDPDRQHLATLLRTKAAAKRQIMIVGADWRLAATLRADGVHLPQGLAQSGRIAPLLGWAKRGRRILTMACHDRNSVTQAGRLGATAIFISPVFPTRSHPNTKTLGLLGLARLTRRILRPVIALGGMNPRHFAATKARGAKAFASVTPFGLKQAGD